ncbi:hypothetical protein CU013_1498 [Enterococcus faecium]|nr:hypothetical protein [Enterococcus faecium]MBK4829162.1 hypothetical protein [Enterococcus faecium]MBK4835161.1 hypothetical protein [Enterococcus faecium]MBK4857854.1 hypothetical protein [Enterococcus faecium]
MARKNGNGGFGKKTKKRYCVSAVSMKIPSSKSAFMTEQISIPTGGFTAT